MFWKKKKAAKTNSDSGAIIVAGSFGADSAPVTDPGRPATPHHHSSPGAGSHSAGGHHSYSAHSGGGHGCGGHACGGSGGH